MGHYGWITLTTDYGTSDGFVAACHGVLGRLAGAVRVLDVTHQVPPGDVTRAAHVLAQTVPHLPPAVHVAVIDPGVGTARRGIVVGTPNGLLVGPDNGLLPWAAEALGGITEAFELANPEWFAPDVSRTFHGRDIFVPCAARLACAAPIEEAGPAVDPATIVRLPDPRVIVGAGWLEAEVVTVDRFGNVQLAADGAALKSIGSEVTVGGVRARHGGTFADAAGGELVVYVDSANRVAVAVNNGRAAVVLSVTPGDMVRIAERGSRPPDTSS